MLELVGLESLAEAEEWGRTRQAEESDGGAGGGSGGEGLRAGRRDSGRAGGAGLGGSGLCRRAQAGAARPRWPSQIIYGKQPVAEAERGRRQVQRVWRAPETAAEELERLCGSPDHQGVVAEVDPYPYGDPGGLLRREDALLVALDQVQDPRNLGAVCRSAEFAGAAGVIIPERRSAAVTAATCKASAGAVEHLAGRPRPQPRRLARRSQGGRLLDLGRRRRGRGRALGRRPQRPHGARPRRRGQRAPPARRRRLRRPRRAAATGQDRVAERLRGGHRAALRGRSPARLSLHRTCKCNGVCKSRNLGLTELRAARKLSPQQG